MFRTTFDAAHRSIYAVVPGYPGWDRLGTAFSVREGGYVATALHVIQNADLMSLKIVRTMGGRQPFSVTVVASDPQTDLALLHLTEPDPQFHPLSLAFLPCSYGQSVLALGYPGTYRNAAYANQQRLMLNLRANGCTVASDLTLPSLDGTPGKNVDVFEVDANLHPGMSGGPVVTLGAEVVGVVSCAFCRPQPVGDVMAAGQAVAEIDYTVAIRASHLAQLLAQVGP